MSGKVKGVQAEIRKINPLATYSPCASHTLNFVGVHAAESCTDVAKNFRVFEALVQYLQCQLREMGHSQRED